MKKYSVIISKFAEQDLDEIVMYYLAMNKEYAKRLYFSLKEKIIELRELPEKGRIVFELEKNGLHDYRELIEGNYRIVYSIHSQEVHILAIIDSRRNLEELLVKKVMEYLNQ